MEKESHLRKMNNIYSDLPLIFEPPWNISSRSRWTSYIVFWHFLTWVFIVALWLWYYQNFCTWYFVIFKTKCFMVVYVQGSILYHIKNLIALVNTKAKQNCRFSYLYFFLVLRFYSISDHFSVREWMHKCTGTLPFLLKSLFAKPGNY